MRESVTANRITCAGIGLAWLLLQGIVWAQENSGWDNTALDGAGMPPLGYRAVPLLGEGHRFDSALDVIPYQNHRDEAELLVLGLKGQIWSVPSKGVQGSVKRHQLVDIREDLKNGGDGKPGYKNIRLLSGILDRDWPERPYLYLAVHQTGVAEQCMIVRYLVSNKSHFSLQGEPEILFSWKTTNHNGCDLQWGPKDGFLYISAGDGSVQGDPEKIGQQVHVIRGSILRLDVHGKPDPGFAYAVPKENPFVGMDDVVPEIWAYGFRNPWRTCFHPTTHELWVADNGDDLWEMLHCVKPGSNAGWSSFEGHQPFHLDLPLGGPTLTHTVPRLVQPHTEIRSIIGGVFYRGKRFPELAGHYVYGCCVTREIWAVSYDASKDTLGKPFRIAKISANKLTAVREDHDGELVLISLSGTVETLAARETKETFRPWPKTLAETLLFTDVPAQKPAVGVEEYDVQARGWADGASSRRFVAVPGSPMVNRGGPLSRASLWIDPGGALVKTLYLDDAPVETQVLYNSGTWQGYTYRWDSAGKTATLVPEEGETVEIKNQTWRYPSRSECMICHNQRSLFGIGFTTPQLNRTNSDGLAQLEQWLKKKIVLDSRNLKARRAVKLADPYDPKSGTLEERVRAYLHVNCAHCHYPTGLGGRSTLHLEHHVPLAHTGMINVTPLVGLLGKPEGKLIVPGDAELSELLVRMNRRGAGQMPLFGSHQIDKDGVALIRDWINSLNTQE